MKVMMETQNNKMIINEFFVGWEVITNLSNIINILIIYIFL